MEGRPPNEYGPGGRLSHVQAGGRILRLQPGHLPLGRQRKDLDGQNAVQKTLQIGRGHPLRRDERPAKIVRHDEQAIWPLRPSQNIRPTVTGIAQGSGVHASSQSHDSLSVGGP